MRIANVLQFTGAIIATALFAGTTHAQLFRAYLSTSGNDANNCSLPAPCRLLPAALTAVADGGEIWMLDSANYNTATVNITKSVSILAVPGVVGSVVATGGPAISISTVSVKVSLRNLVIAPLPGAGGTNGINMTNGTSLTVDHCLVANLAGNGILVASAAKVRIVDSLIRDNDGYGIYLGSGATADISGTKLLGNGIVGVIVSGTAAMTTTTVAISDSVMAGNLIGLQASSQTASALVRASVNRSTMSNNNIGIVANNLGTAIVTVSNNLVTNNITVGLSQSGTAALESLGNNTVRQNGATGTTNTSGTITTVSGI